MRKSIPVPVRCSSPLRFGSVAGSGGRSSPIPTMFCSVLVCWSGSVGFGFPSSGDGVGVLCVFRVCFSLFSGGGSDDATVFIRRVSTVW